MEYIISLLPLIPIAGGLLVILLKTMSIGRFSENIVFIVAVVLTTLLSIYTAYRAISSEAILKYCFGGWFEPVGICYLVDSLSSIYIAFISIIYIAVGLYSIWYGRHLSNTATLYSLLLLHEAGLLGVVLTWDIFNLYVAIELAGLTAYSIVAYYKHRASSLLASVRYALAGGLYTSLLLLSIGLAYTTYAGLGYTHVYRVNTILASNINPRGAVYTLFLLSMGLWVGFLISALYPNHFWLPGAHSEAPSPGSAVLSGLTAGVGVYIVARFIYTLYKPFDLTVFTTATLVLAAVNIFYGSLRMAVENDVKRILAYSTIVNTGFIYMGVSLTTATGLAAGILHTVNHAIGKALAFLAIGAIVHTMRSRNIYALEGAGKVMPYTYAFLLLSILQLIGLPPLPGFYSKLLLYQAYVEKGLHIPAIIIIVGTIASLNGYFRLLEHLWHQPLHIKPGIKEPLSIYQLSAYILLTALMLTLATILPHTLHNLVTLVDTFTKQP